MTCEDFWYTIDDYTSKQQLDTSDPIVNMVATQLWNSGFSDLVRGIIPVSQVIYYFCGNFAMPSSFYSMTYNQIQDAMCPRCVDSIDLLSRLVLSIEGFGTASQNELVRESAKQILTSNPDSVTVQDAINQAKTEYGTTVFAIEPQWLTDEKARLASLEADLAYVQSYTSGKSPSVRITILYKGNYEDAWGLLEYLQREVNASRQVIASYSDPNIDLFPDEIRPEGIQVQSQASMDSLLSGFAQSGVTIPEGTITVTGGQLQSYYVLTPSSFIVDLLGNTVKKIRHLSILPLTSDQASLLESRGYDVTPVTMSITDYASGFNDPIALFSAPDAIINGMPVTIFSDGSTSMKNEGIFDQSLVGSALNNTSAGSQPSSISTGISGGLFGFVIVVIIMLISQRQTRKVITFG